jgi:putative Ca2+/H+ antiporter (TMEM165/GDT1 family)
MVSWDILSYLLILAYLKEIMNSLLASIPLTTIAEIGDKTQLLSLLLAVRFKKYVPIILGIVFATLLNHFASAYIGKNISEIINSEIFSIFVATSFILIGLWILKQDKQNGLNENLCKYGCFFASFIAFFIAEIGDKTQIATMALALEYQSIFWITIGTTTGILIANIPVVLMGEKATSKIPLKYIRYFASSGFILFGILSFFN